MKADRFKFALKWVLILIGINLIASLPLLASLDGQSPFFAALGMFVAIAMLFVQIVVITMAIIKYARANHNRNTPEDVWAFGGLMVLMLAVLNSTVMMGAFAMLAPDTMEEGPSMLEMAGMGAISMFFVLVIYAIFFLIIPMSIAGQWRTFEKGGKPGWACLVPIYNVVCLAEIGKQPVWWVLMLFIPFVNFVFYILLLNALVKSFGKDGGWTVGLLFLPFAFYPMLAWGDARYQYGDFEPSETLGVEDHLVE